MGGGALLCMRFEDAGSLAKDWETINRKLNSMGTPRKHPNPHSAIGMTLLCLSELLNQTLRA